MLTRVCLLGMLAFAVPLGAQTLPPATASPVLPAAAPMAGLWTGSLETGTVTLRLAVHIAAGPDGGYDSTLDSVDQGVLGISVAKTLYAGHVLTLSLPSLKAQFAGTLGADGKTLTGTWTQGASSLPLTLTRTDKAPVGPRRPQEPHPPFPYAARDVVYADKAGGVVLAGTLSIPRGKGPFPAAVLITGSGSHDRDETLFGHKPFLVISDFLTRRGIAVLRVDDRGVGGSTGSKAQSNDHDFARDVRAGVAFLQAQPEINPRKIGLVGHSEGGLVAPLAAANAHNIAFVVLLAGPGVPGQQILREQNTLILRSLHADPALIAWSTQQQAKTFAILQSTPDNARATAKLDALLQTSLASMPSEMQPHAADYQANFKAQEQTVLTPWFRGFLASRPAPVLAQVHCPVLALGGSRDLQVPARESLHAIAHALKIGGNKDVTVREMPGLNHLFQTAPTGALAEYGQIEKTFSPVALKVMGDWIARHTLPAH